MGRLAVQTIISSVCIAIAIWIVMGPPQPAAVHKDHGLLAKSLLAAH
jgi:hypothetical protein